MTAVVAAIETRYAGCRFRSRLEARWAIFFDALNLAWEYEREGFDLAVGRYLPDFWLPTLDAWYEVKGALPTHRENAVAEDLSEHTGKPVYIAWGDIPQSADRRTGDIQITGWDSTSGPYADAGYAWCVCPCGCHQVGIEFEGRGARIHLDRGGRGHTGDHRRILHAYQQARSARFEHGEHGWQ